MLAGEVEAGRIALQKAMRPKLSGRSPADALVDLGFTGMLVGGGTASELAGPEVESADGGGFIRAHLRCVEAARRGDWVVAAAFTPDPGNMVTGAQIAQLWARWRRQEESGGLREQLEEVAASLDAPLPAGLVFAAMSVAGEETAVSRGRVERLTRELERRARWSLSARFWQAAEERLLAMVEKRAGDERRSAEHLARAQRLAPACSFAGGLRMLSR